MLAAARQLVAPLVATSHAALYPSSHAAARTFSAPCVYDALVRFFVIDADGKRHAIKGLVGGTLASAMYESGLFPDYDDFMYGPDSPDPDAHVYVGREFLPVLGKPSEKEQAAMSHIANNVRGKCAPPCSASVCAGLRWPDPMRGAVRLRTASRQCSRLIIVRGLRDLLEADAYPGHATAFAVCSIAGCDRQNASMTSMHVRTALPHCCLKAFAMGR